MMHSIPGRRVILSLFLIFLLLPIYWLVNMSFKTNYEIVSTMTLWPHRPTIANYMRIFTDESWYSGYINSLKYVVINTLISISAALPAAYAFSRDRRNRVSRRLFVPTLLCEDFGAADRERHRRRRLLLLYVLLGRTLAGAHAD